MFRGPRLWAEVRRKRSGVSTAGRAQGTASPWLPLARSRWVLCRFPLPPRTRPTRSPPPIRRYYGLDRARAKGYTGKGVTIAMIDGRVDTSVPELAGANISVTIPCTITAVSRTVNHGTGVVSILVAPGYGVAPDAALLAYQLSFGKNGDVAAHDCADSAATRITEDWLLNQAMNDGAQVINYSASSVAGANRVKWAVARSISSGVIVVASAGNDGNDNDVESLSKWSGVVSVSAIGVDDSRQDYSSWGQGVVTALIGGPFSFRDLVSGEVKQSSGTSYAAPVVTGVLALAKQRWPEAISNQLLQLLVKTGLNPDHGWNQYTGFGAIDPGAILNTDPSQFPDENPLIEKQGGSSPTQEDVQQYVDGVVDPAEIDNDNSYTYRGLDESKVGNWQNVYQTHLGTSPRYHQK